MGRRAAAPMRDHPISDTLELCRALDLDEQSRNLILGETAARLLAM